MLGLSCRGTWDPDAALGLLRKPAPINACSTNFIKMQPAWGTVSYVRKIQLDTGMFSVRGAKYLNLILPSIQIHNLMALECQFCFKLKVASGRTLCFINYHKHNVGHSNYTISFTINNVWYSGNKVNFHDLSFFRSSNQNNSPTRFFNQNNSPTRFSDSWIYSGGLCHFGAKNLRAGMPIKSVFCTFQRSNGKNEMFLQLF